MDLKVGYNYAKPQIKAVLVILFLEVLVILTVEVFMSF